MNTSWPKRTCDQSLGTEERIRFLIILQAALRLLDCKSLTAIRTIGLGARPSAVAGLFPPRLTAAVWVERAARRGNDPAAAAWLSVAHSIRGSHGVPENASRAAALLSACLPALEAEARAGDPEACLRLGALLQAPALRHARMLGLTLPERLQVAGRAKRALARDDAAEVRTSAM
jgi:hypothetical protein